MSFEFWSRIKLSKFVRKDLDQILNYVPDPQARMRNRISWFFDLLEWIRREGVVKGDQNFETGTPQAKRLRYLLYVLEKNHPWKSKVAKVLRSIIKDSRAVELFLETGVSGQDSFVTEFLDRLQELWLPVVPREHELSYIFSQNFQNQNDLEWVRKIDEATFHSLLELFEFDVGVDEQQWNRMKADATEALAIIALQIQTLGLSNQIRHRLSTQDYQKNTFYLMGRLIERYINEKDETIKFVIGQQVEKKVEECFFSIGEVQQHLDTHGVSVQIVFQIEKLEVLLRRVFNLVYILQQKQIDPSTMGTFLEILVADSIKSKSPFSLINQNFSLLARKIVERTAETGEHYITRTGSEYITMLEKSLGGGLITSFTTLIKFLVTNIGLSSFYQGFFASLNYSLSFLVIHFSHFTLATKQSSLTAPALAAKMQSLRKPEELESLIDEVVNTLRTQVAAVIGNIVGVIPLTFLICWGFQYLSHQPLISETKALKVLSDYSLLGPTPVYAIFTGVLLWFSSLISGWVDNWYVYHRISPALSQNRRLIFVFGERVMRAFTVFLGRNMAAIAGNVSLGFLLGLAPAILQFFGLFLDVRHVTLSTGSLTAALVSLPLSIFGDAQLWLAIAGIFSMAVLNIAVSFALALFLALRARKIKAPERSLIYSAFIRRLRQKPLSFFWPISKNGCDS